MDSKLKILLIEDSETDADLLIRFLKKEKINFSYKRVWNKVAFINEIKVNNYDLIISDHTLPSFNGMEAFRIAKDENINIPFILITGTVSEKVLTGYTKEGIDDYILKDNLLRLPTAIENVVSKKKIEHLHAKLEIAYKDIKNSINYAKIIQDSILPDESMLHNDFLNSFILFMPKDVLSGDFYWLEKSENLFFVAVADCTGHGVPGALLAMMGNNLLNEAVNIKKIVQPSAILERLCKRVRRILKHGSITLNDGMDIAFCTIDLKNKSMMYAGANRPLFIERGNELIEFKPDKISIGGAEYDKMQFTNHTIPIKTNDRIFLFSDGYADQFHFKTGKKIMIRCLKELLISSSDLPFDEQKRFMINFFENWKGDKEQVDDVLLMCIQIP